MLSLMVLNQRMTEDPQSPALFWSLYVHTGMCHQHTLFYHRPRNTHICNTYTKAYTHRDMHTLTSTDTHFLTNTYTQKDRHADIYTLIHTHIYTYIHTLLHTHTHAPLSTHISKNPIRNNQIKYVNNV